MKSNRLYATISAYIAKQIRSGAYSIDERLPSERELAKQFDVSRPTIREAMIALEVDGLVEIVMGSGVYVRSARPINGKSQPADIGPFELLEARALIEGEAAALAAVHINTGQLEHLRTLVSEMRIKNEQDVLLSEDADRRFHLSIAKATQNSAIVQSVSSLWDARTHSVQSEAFDRKLRSVGVKPRIDEHQAIVEALATRDPDKARDAMRGHLRGVAKAVFEITEAEAMESARAQVVAQRRRFSGGGALS